jgi:glycosyltransferase involved in cell wall biosynthesis
VDDGSRDRTWQIIRRLAKDAHIIGIRQSRNRGHQNTVLAGLMEAKDLFDITISIDCDGQDDLDAMDQMVDAYLHGYEVVYGVRSSREEDNFCKRFTAEAFYRLMKLLGAEVVFNHADYRLISGRVLRELAEFKEVNIFLRGLVPLAGFESTSVYYKRHRRAAGKSHYPLGKMLGLAFDGITSLSARPIHTITSMGLMVSALSFVMIVWIVVCFCMGRTVQGWASTCVIASFIGGIQLLCTGVIGEYVGKIYLETKARPRYIISERTFEREDLL